MITRHGTRVAGLALLAVAALASCGEEAEPGVGAGTGAALEITTDDAQLGTILVDGRGRTLYLFMNDSPGMSTCEGECLAAWPPLGGR